MGLRAITVLPQVSSFTNTLSTQFTHASQNSVSFGNNFDRSGAGNFSISIWCKFNTLTTQGDIFANYTAASGLGYELLVTSTGQIDWSMNNGANFMEVHTASSSVTTSTWYHIVVVATGSAVANQTVYINNVSKSLTTVSNTFSGSMSNSNVAHVGWRASIGCDMQVNQCTFWDGTALSSGNVATLYNSGHPGNALNSGISGLKGYWYLGSGDNATSAGGFVDHSGNGFNGTGVNTPVFVSDVP